MAITPRANRSPFHCKSTRSGTFDTRHHLNFQPLTGCSFEDALRAFFQPIKTNDPRLDFYTAYKKEAIEHDTNYVKKYGEDLNTTLIFVRRSSFLVANRLTCPHRQVCSLPSAPLSSSTSIPTSNPTQASNPLPSSAQFSSLSISPPSQARLP